MKRKQLIKNLEKERKSRLITYITGERKPFRTQIAQDVVPLLSEQLDYIGKEKKISLFLYTHGGDMLAPVRIVKLIRNHCEKFEVIVPYRAHSAGTLIALGADNIVMSKLGELTPVDPSTGHPFNPSNPYKQGQKLPISVEDLNSYFLLAKEQAGVEKEQMSEVMRILAEKVHPLALGNAYRTYRMGKMIAERLLRLHINPQKEKKRIDHIVKEITGDITIHAYPIDREEAKSIGLKIEKAIGETGEYMRKLYTSYAKAMKLGEKFNPQKILRKQDIEEFKYVGGYLETSDTSYQFSYKGKVKKTIKNNKPAVDVNVRSLSWEEIKN